MSVDRFRCPRCGQIKLGSAPLCYDCATGEIARLREQVADLAAERDKWRETAQAWEAVAEQLNARMPMADGR